MIYLQLSGVAKAGDIKKYGLIRASEMYAEQKGGFE